MLWVYNGDTRPPVVVLATQMPRGSSRSSRRSAHMQQPLCPGHNQNLFNSKRLRLGKVKWKTVSWAWEGVVGEKRMEQLEKGAIGFKSSPGGGVEASRHHFKYQKSRRRKLVCHSMPCSTCSMFAFWLAFVAFSWSLPSICPVICR